MSECYNCEDSGTTNPVTIDNSDKVNTDYLLTETNVDFDVDFSGDLDESEMDSVSVELCDDCRKNSVKYHNDELLRFIQILNMLTLFILFTY
jgi:hypothetical protein